MLAIRRTYFTVRDASISSRVNVNSYRPIKTDFPHFVLFPLSLFLSPSIVVESQVRAALCQWKIWLSSREIRERRARAGLWSSWCERRPGKKTSRGFTRAREDCCSPLVLIFAGITYVMKSTPPEEVTIDVRHMEKIIMAPCYRLLLAKTVTALDQSPSNSRFTTVILSSIPFSSRWRAKDLIIINPTSLGDTLSAWWLEQDSDVDILRKGDGCVWAKKSSTRGKVRRIKWSWIQSFVDAWGTRVVWHRHGAIKHCYAAGNKNLGRWYHRNFSNI